MLHPQEGIRYILPCILIYTKPSISLLYQLQTHCFSAPNSLLNLCSAIMDGIPFHSFFFFFFNSKRIVFSVEGARGTLQEEGALRLFQRLRVGMQCECVDIWGCSILAIHPEHTVPGNLAALVWPDDNLPVTLSIWTSPAYPGALIPSAHFPSPIGLSPAVLPALSHSRHSSQQGYLMLQASCHSGIPNSSYAPMHQLPASVYLPHLCSKGLLLVCPLTAE